MADPLTGTTWYLAGPVRVPDDLDVTITFSNGTVSGFAGCNRFRGTYRADGDSLRFGAVLSTRMFCGVEAMAVEDELLAAFPTVDTFSLNASMLVLVCDDDRAYAFTPQPPRLTRRPAPRPVHR